MEQPFKYFAFISCSSKDSVWGRRLQKKMESLRMPTALCKQRGWKRTPMNPVFYAPMDIQPGALSEELHKQLKASRYLIVICSPNSAKSKWVSMEIEYFHQLGRSNDIHFFIVDGVPHSNDPQTECFNPVIERLGIPEILGANINEKHFKQPRLNRERAYMQLFSKLLGVDFDTIWQRHKRLTKRKVAAWSIGILAILTALVAAMVASRPADVSLQVREASVHNENLPPMRNAVVTLSADNIQEIDTLRDFDDQALFLNIPHKYLNKPVRITVDCEDFLPTDTIIVLSREVSVNISRDPKKYGDIRFRLWDRETERVVPGVSVEIAGQTAISDAGGWVTLSVPLEKQRKTYPITASVMLHEDSLFMPCGNDYYMFINE